MGKITKKTLSVFLSVLMILSCWVWTAPDTHTHANAAAGKEEYYYPAGTNFAYDIAISTRDYKALTGGRENDCKNYLTNAGYTLLGVNLNDGISRTHFVHMGYKMGTGDSYEAQAIRAVAFYNGSNPPDTYTYNINGHDCTFTLVKNAYINTGTVSSGTIDLNRDAGGDDIFTYYTTDPNAGQPIDAFDYESKSSSFSGNDDNNICKTPAFWLNTNSKGTAGKMADLNANAGGNYLSAFYHQTGTSVDTGALREAISAAASKLGSKSNYTSASISTLQSAYDAGMAIVNDYEDGLSDEYTQEKINSAKDAINNAINALQTTVTLNANGGSFDGATTKSFDETVGAAATYDYKVSSYTPTRTGYTFKGWATSASATSGSTSTVNAGLKPTIYAIWDANEYKVTFDNMFDLAAWNVSPSDAKVLEKTSSSLTIVSNEHKMDSSGNQVVNNDGNTAWTYSIPVKANTTYVIEADIAFGENFSREMDIFALVSAKDGTQDKDCIVLTENGKLEGGHPKVSSTTAGKNTLSFTTSDDSAFVRFRFDSNLAGNVLTISDIRMYEVGTVDAGAPYVPSVTVEYDGDYSNLPTPTRTGYTFLGWYDADGKQVKATDTVKITKDIVLYSKWEVSKYTIKWANHDGTILETDENVTYGTTPTYNGATPTKPKDAQYTYTFTGWSPAISPATADVTYTAQFSNTTNKYTVTWKNHDGTVLKSEQVEYGTTPTAPANPTRESNQEFNYTFKGWDKEIAAVNGDVTYTATYTATKRSYTITWKNDDGSVIDTTTVEYGKVPTHAAATKAADAQYTYTFTGWSPTVAEVTGDATYTATFSATKNSYTITWKNDDGSVIDTTTVEYGKVPTHADATKAATAQYTYTFAGWTPAVTAVTGDATYKATFSATKNSYTITWVVNGVETTETYEYGTTPTYKNGTPTKAADAQYTYSFAGWSPAVAEVTDNATYTAQFDKTAKDYTLTVEKVVNGETTTKTYTVKYGHSYNVTSEYGELTGYTRAVDGKLEGTMPANNVTVRVIYSPIDYTLTINYKYANGTQAVASHIARVAFGAGYDIASPTITGYTPNPATVSGTMPAENVTVDVTYNVNSYTLTIKYQYEDRTEAKPDYIEQVEYNSSRIYSSPEIEGYTANQPVVSVTMPAEDKTITVIYTKKTYKVTWVDWNDVELEVDEAVPYYTMPEFNGNTPTKAATAEYTYEHSGWTPVINFVTGDITYKATYTATKRSYEITWLNDDNTLIDKTTVEYGEVPTHEAVTKTADAQYTYTFTGWSPAVAEVTGNATYTAQFDKTAKDYTLTIKKIVNGEETTVEHTVAYGAEYDYTSDYADMTGYTRAVDGKLEGTMPANNVTVRVIYSPIDYTLTINYKYADGTQAAEAHTETLEYGAEYSVASPTITGYAPNLATVSGTMGASDVTVEVTYSVNSYTLTINYKYADGTQAAKSHTESVKYGAEYSVTSPAIEGYTADIPVVSGTMPAENKEITVTYKKNSYTITWKNDDGSVIDTTTVEHGIVPTHADPTKANTAEYTYTFDKWADANGNKLSDLPAATDNATYTATFSATKNSYTITWKNDDGTVIDTTTVEYGTVPTHADATKANTAEYTYTFTGWSPAVVAVTGNAEYTATYTATKNKYTVTWIVDGKETAEEYEHGVTPTFKVSTDKAADAQFTYTFAGWDKEIAAVTGDVTYTATYSTTVNTYTVTWKNHDGKVLETDKDVPYGTIPTYDSTATPKKDATAEYTYEHDGWDPAVTAVTGDVTYTAIFTAIPKTYNVKWVVDGNTTSVLTAFGSDIVNPADPEKEGYTFKGWKDAEGNIVETFGKMPAHDVIYTAYFEINSYTVTWNVDGAETTESYAYGATINKPAAPEKAGYTFTGWTPEVPATMPASNQTFTATWHVNQYSIKFNTDGGSIVSAIVKDYGAKITATDIPANPTKEGYTFKGWDTEIPATMPAGDMTITAQWTINQYTITFDTDGGTEIAPITKDYGEAITAPETPTKTGHTFDGWDKTIPATMPAENVTITAKWNVNQYTITFDTDGGTEIAPITKDYGEAITAPETPTKTGHTFDKWVDSNGKAVTFPVTMPVDGLALKAIWTPIKYTITFIGDNNVELQRGQVAYGEKTEYNGAVPTKPDENGKTYAFSGWATIVGGTVLNALPSVTGDATYYAVFVGKDTKFNVIWKFESGDVTVEDVIYGTKAITKLPNSSTEKTADAEYSYQFKGWSISADRNETVTLEEYEIKAETTFYPVYEKTPVNYTVTWKDGDNKYTETTVAFDSKIDLPTNPEKTGYTFAGWFTNLDDETIEVTAESTMPANNLTVYAKWTVNQYTITFDTDGGSAVDAITKDYATAITAPEDPTKTGYTFKGWESLPETMPAENITVKAKWEINKYTITFDTAGGSTVDAITQDYATDITAPAAPTKTGYTFAGWDKTIPATMPAENVTITAKWTINQYKITFDTVGGTAVAPITQDYNTAVTAPAAPTKTGHTFAGWENLPATMPANNITVRATWTVDKYTVTWMNGTTTVKTSEVDYDKNIVLPAEPTKEGHTFAGWFTDLDNPASQITAESKMPAGNITAYAKWNVNMYNVTFNLNGGNISGDTADVERRLAYGATISAPANPTKTGYDFAGWSPTVDETVPAKDVTYTATWTAKQITVTFDTDNGSVVDAITKAYGETITLPDAPTKTGYDFQGWYTSEVYADGTKLAETMPVPAEDTTVYAKWQIKTYTIKFVDENDAELKSITVEHGQTPSYDGTPIKTGDAQYSYAFAGWTPEIVAATADATYKATYTQSVNKYTIKFVNEDGSVLQTGEVAYGETPSYTGETPIKEGDAQYSYTHSGWTPEIATVTANATYTAIYTETVNEYTINFVNDDGSVLQTGKVAYGETPSYTGETPIKEGDAQYSYTHSGWTPEIDSVTGEATYTATYTQSVNKYTVTWVVNGEDVETDENVEYGTMPSYDGETPEKEADAQYTYTFDKWTPTVSVVTGNVTYTATFAETTRNYTVTWQNENGVVLETDEDVPYGTIPSYDGETPEKAATAKYTYTFDNWTTEIAAVKGDVTYIAKYKETVNKYKITFVDEDGATVLYSADVDYDTVPEYKGATPTKAATAQYTYTFAGWTPTIVKVTGEATYKATYTATVNKYTITFNNYDGTELYKQTLDYGATPVYAGNTPTKAADAQYTYTFAGWDPAIATVTANATYTAIYTETVNEYTIKFVNEDGSVLQTGEVAYGETPSYDGETPVKAATAQYTYTFAGWTPAIDSVTGEATYTATYTQSVNKYTVTWVFADETEDTQTLDYGTTITAPANTTKKADETNHYSYTWGEVAATVTGDVTYTEELVTEAHSGEWTVSKAATCTENGEEKRVCTVCGYTETRVVDATGHTPGAAATCTTAQTCTVCGAIIAPALGHKEVIVPAVPAKCGVPGLSEGRSCERCGLVFAEQTETPALEHDLDTSRTENNLTRPVLKDGEWTDGYYTFRCKREGCAYFETEAVKRADYSEYDKVMASIEKLLGDDSIPADAKAKLRKLLNERKDNYIATEQTILNKDVANIKNAISEAYPDAGFKLAIDGNRIHYIGTVLDLNVIKYNDDISVDAGNVQWLTSNENVVVYSNGKLLAVGTGKVTLTAVSGILETTFDVEIVEGGRLRTVKFTPIKGTYFIVEEYYITYDGATMYWSDNYDVYFRVRTTQSYSYETFMVYMNGKEITPNAEGYYVVPADTGDVTITLSGAVFDDEGDGDNGTGKFNFWEWLLRLFRKIGDFFRNLFGIA